MSMSDNGTMFDEKEAEWERFLKNGFTFPWLKSCLNSGRGIPEEAAAIEVYVQMLVDAGYTLCGCPFDESFMTFEPCNCNTHVYKKVGLFWFDRNTKTWWCDPYDM